MVVIRAKGVPSTGRQLGSVHDRNLGGEAGRCAAIPLEHDGGSRASRRIDSRQNIVGANVRAAAKEGKASSKQGGSHAA
jgi:hypothetical protein